MAHKAKVHNLGIRVAITLVIAAGGFIFPALFLLAALIAWSIIGDVRHPPEPSLHTVTAEDPAWKKYFLSRCESPAETAFLDAMIDAYALQPRGGELHCGGLRLALQVPIEPYRVDFLVDKWLVVEIDGAAYHSSPEAIARDTARDKNLGEQGYAVLRIPAKVVFSTPAEAVDRVRAARNRKSPSSAASSASASLPGNARDALRAVGNIASSMNKAVEDFNESLDLRINIKNALREPELAFYAERLAIDKSIAQSESKIDLDQWLSQSDEHRESYACMMNELQEAVELRQAQKSDSSKQSGKPAPVMVRFSAPPPHPNPKVNEAIERFFQKLVTERSAYFESIWHKLQDNEQLAESVRQQLHEVGLGEYWITLSQGTDQDLPLPTESRPETGHPASKMKLT